MYKLNTRTNMTFDFHNDRYPSLVNREESAAIKGVYILLIVLGHNYIFTHSTDRLQIMLYMYMFHIAGFFMLPYLYGSKGLSWRSIGNHAVRLLWPFIILAISFYLGYYVLFEGNKFAFKDLAEILEKGNAWTLRHFCGFQVLWFLPSMFLAMIIHDLYFYGKKISQIIYLILGLFMVGGILLPEVDFLRNFIVAIYSLPWTLWAALLYGFFGAICRKILIRISKYKLPAALMCCIIAIWVSIMYFNDIPGWRDPSAGDRWGVVFYPIAFMIPVVLASPKICRLNWLRWLGENSLLIYLIHPFIGFIIMYFFPTIYVNPPVVQVAAIIISFAAILVSTVLITMLIKRCTSIYSFLFPRNVEQWCKLWQRK